MAVKAFPNRCLTGEVVMCLYGFEEKVVKLLFLELQKELMVRSVDHLSLIIVTLLHWLYRTLQFRPICGYLR